MEAIRMEKKVNVCDVCGKIAWDEKQKRSEEWLEIYGGALKGINVWLEKPRKIGNCPSYLLTVGYKERLYDFCSIHCLVKALKAIESI